MKIKASEANAVLQVSDKNFTQNKIAVNLIGLDWIPYYKIFPWLDQDNIFPATKQGWTKIKIHSWKIKQLQWK